MQQLPPTCEFLRLYLSSPLSYSWCCGSFCNLTRHYRAVSGTQAHLWFDWPLLVLSSSVIFLFAVELHFFFCRATSSASSRPQLLLPSLDSRAEEKAVRGQKKNRSQHHCCQIIPPSSRSFCSLFVIGSLTKSWAYLLTLLDELEQIVPGCC